MYSHSSPTGYALLGKKADIGTVGGEVWFVAPPPPPSTGPIFFFFFGFFFLFFLGADCLVRICNRDT